MRTLVLGLLVLGAAHCAGDESAPREENALPRIVSTDPPIRGCPRVDRSSPEPFVITAVVADEDLEDVLDARQFVDGQLGSQDPEIEIDPQGDGTERLVTASFDPVEDFDQRGLFVVEIDVVDDASGWIGSSAQVEDDVGRITQTWTVLAHDGDGIDDNTACREPFE